MERENEKELTYILPENETAVFEKLLRELENTDNGLGIESFSIYLATMEELFQKFVILPPPNLKLFYTPTF